MPQDRSPKRAPEMPIFFPGPRCLLGVWLLPAQLPVAPPVPSAGPQPAPPARGPDRGTPGCVPRSAPHLEAPQAAQIPLVGLPLRAALVAVLQQGRQPSGVGLPPPVAALSMARRKVLIREA